jgi:hypothetical protein
MGFNRAPGKQILTSSLLTSEVKQVIREELKGISGNRY